MRKKFCWLVLAMLLLVQAMVVAQPPPFAQTIDTETTDFLTVVYPLHMHYETNSGFILNFDVLDSNFSKVDDTNAHCNFVAILENGSVNMFANLSYSSDNRFWSFYVNPENNTAVGHYSFYVYCDDFELNQSGFVSQSYIITNSGEELDIPGSIAYSVLLFLMIVLMVACLIWAFNIDGNDTVSMGDLVEINYKKYAKFFLYFLSYLFFTLSLFFAWQISYLFIITTWSHDILRVLFKISWVVLFPLFAVTLTLMVVKFITDLRIDKMVKRGLPPRYR